VVKNLDRSFFRFVTMHACDGRTDGQTESSSPDRVCIPCSAVKISNYKYRAGKLEDRRKDRQTDMLRQNFSHSKTDRPRL